MTRLPAPMRKAWRAELSELYDSSERFRILLRDAHLEPGRVRLEGSPYDNAEQVIVAAEQGGRAALTALAREVRRDYAHAKVTPEVAAWAVESPDGAHSEPQRPGLASATGPAIPRWGVAAGAAVVVALAVGSWALAPVPPPAEVEVAGFKIRGSGRVPLHPEDTLVAGDAFEFSVTATEPVHVQVVRLAGGQVEALFPEEEAEAVVQPGKPERIPGGRQVFQQDGQGGFEHIYLVLSQRPLGEVDTDLAAELGRIRREGSSYATAGREGADAAVWALAGTRGVTLAPDPGHGQWREVPYDQAEILYFPLHVRQLPGAGAP